MRFGIIMAMKLDYIGIIMQLQWDHIGLSGLGFFRI
jgi:hypothetical protein